MLVVNVVFRVGQSAGKKNDTKKALYDVVCQTGRLFGRNSTCINAHKTVITNAIISRDDIAVVVVFLCFGGTQSGQFAIVVVPQKVHCFLKYK